MGNETNCSKLCEKKTVIDHSTDDILITEYIVPCQICNSQFKHQILKQHIDLVHYATIKEQENGDVCVECILCGKNQADLTEHGEHIKEKHPYAFVAKTTKSNGQQIVTQNAKQNRMVSQDQLNKSKKGQAIKLTSKKDFQILNQLQQNRFEASVYGVPHEVTKYSKDFRGAEYQQQLAEAQLIWSNIFKQKRKCRYYFLDTQPSKRSILCIGFIFISKNN